MNFAAGDAVTGKENVYEVVVQVNSQSEVDEQSPSSHVEPTTARTSDSASDTSSEGVAFKTSPDETPQHEIFLGAESEDTAEERIVEAFNDTSVQLRCDGNDADDQANLVDSANSNDDDASPAKTAKLLKVDDKVVDSCVRKARFPLPELTARVNGPS